MKPQAFLATLCLAWLNPLPANALIENEAVPGAGARAAPIHDTLENPNPLDMSSAANAQTWKGAPASGTAFVPQTIPQPNRSAGLRHGVLPFSSQILPIASFKAWDPMNADLIPAPVADRKPITL